MSAFSETSCAFEGFRLTTRDLHYTCWAYISYPAPTPGPGPHILLATGHNQRPLLTNCFLLGAPVICLLHAIRLRTWHSLNSRNLLVPLLS
jgi:hypothetical protein